MWTARALAVVHTAMFDAWAAYDRTAMGVHWSESLRRPWRERTPGNKRIAVSFAAYRTLVDLFRQLIPADEFRSYIATPPFAEYTSDTAHSAPRVPKC